jgi:hypothetical protein
MGVSVEKQVQCRDPRLFGRVGSIEQSNQVIAVGLKFDLPLLEFKN